jgi:hypothetical protein
VRASGVHHGRHFTSASWSELELWSRYPGLCTPGDVALLERDGYVRGGRLTKLGEDTLAAAVAARGR